MDSPRIALCLSGHVRTFERTFPGLKRHLLEPHDPDVFIHTWSVVGHQNTSWRPRPSDDTRISPERLQSLSCADQLLVERQRRRPPALAQPGTPTPRRPDLPRGQPSGPPVHLLAALLDPHGQPAQGGPRGGPSVHVRRGGAVALDFRPGERRSRGGSWRASRATATRSAWADPLKTRHGHPGGGGGCKLCAGHAPIRPACQRRRATYRRLLGSSPAMDAYAGLYDRCLDLYERAARDNEATYTLRNGWTPSGSRSGGDTSTSRSPTGTTSRASTRSDPACEHLVDRAGQQRARRAVSSETRPRTRGVRQDPRTGASAAVGAARPWCRRCASCARHSAGRSCRG